MSHLASRLPIEFAKRGIKTLTEANRFWEEEYRELFNQKFSVEPEAESIFTGTFSFKNRCFQILDEGFPIINARREIKVLLHPRYGIRMEYQGRVYAAIRYINPQNKNASTKVPKKVVKTVEPHLKLRHSSEEWRAIWWMEDYNLSLKFLYELFFEKQQSAS